MRRAYLGLLFGIGIFFAGLAQGQTAESYALPDVLKRMETRAGTWIGYQANIRLHAYIGETHAVCDGELAYQKLDERMMLKCFSEEKSGRLLFAFQSSDREFEFYQPSFSLVYQGTIFDLEDRAYIDSQIKPLSLYRALKPYFITPASASLEGLYGQNIRLAIRSLSPLHTPYIKRRIWLNQQDDVIREIYYRPNGETEAVIQRKKFKTLSARDTGSTKVTYPRVIILEEPAKDEKKEARKTKIEFRSIRFESIMDPALWKLNVPAGTQRINLTDEIPVLSPDPALQS